MDEIIEILDGISNKDRWFLISPVRLSFKDKIKLLFGYKLYAKFVAPTGRCSAACRHEVSISKAKWARDDLPFRMADYN